MQFEETASAFQCFIDIIIIQHANKFAHGSFRLSKTWFVIHIVLQI
jgi:hypothetical protein